MTLAPLTPGAVLWTVFAVGQALYFVTFLIEIYFFSLPVRLVDEDAPLDEGASTLPPIILLYPVLREREDTMRTTLMSLQRIEYPADRRRIVAIPNADDEFTVASLRRLAGEFPFLEVLPVPSTADERWEAVWSSWDANPRAYWWHGGDTRGRRDLPPKKTRQLIYAVYTLAGETPDPDLLFDYIDADSCPPPSHFMAAARGMRDFDVLQAENVAGNLTQSMPAAWHALDHMAWDGSKYRHLSAPSQPFWVLGKGLFFRAVDLVELGGFHPWTTIEDPEVGLRFWAAGKRLGVIRSPLVEEVPSTWIEGVHQRRRWVCGFFQALDPRVFKALGFSWLDRVKAWMIFLPCLSLWINAIGVPTGAWALWAFLKHENLFPLWLVILCCVNLVCFFVSMIALYTVTWRRTALVLPSVRRRLGYMLRVNPLFVMLWWMLWLIPLAMGLWMYLRNQGLVWRRTEKIDANHELIRAVLADTAAAPASARSTSTVTQEGVL